MTAWLHAWLARRRQARQAAEKQRLRRALIGLHIATTTPTRR